MKVPECAGSVWGAFRERVSRPPRTELEAAEKKLAEARERNTFLEAEYDRLARRLDNATAREDRTMGRLRETERELLQLKRERQNEDRVTALRRDEIAMRILDRVRYVTDQFPQPYRDEAARAFQVTEEVRRVLEMMRVTAPRMGEKDDGPSEN